MKFLYLFVFLIVFLGMRKAECSYGQVTESLIETEYEVDNHGTVTINDSDFTFDVDKLLEREGRVLFIVKVDTGETDIEDFSVVPTSICNHNIRGGTKSNKNKTKVSSIFSIENKILQDHSEGKLVINLYFDSDEAGTTVGIALNTEGCNIKG